MLRYFKFNKDILTRHSGLCFFLIVSLNVLFKLPFLGFSSFWYDEIISLQSASLDFGHIKHVSEWDNNPPFYYYCLSVWIKLFDDSEFTSRLLSVIFSSLAGGVLFLFANRFFNKITAIMVSLFYLSHNIIYYYSHEARAYALVVLLSLISSWLFFNFKEKPNYRNTCLLGLLNFLLIYTHYVSGLVIIVQSVIMLVYFNKDQKTKFFMSLGITCLLTMLRFTKKQFLLILAFNSPEKTFWLKKSDTTYLKEVVSTFLFQPTFVIPLLLLIGLSVYFIFYFKAKDKRSMVLYSLLLGVGCIMMLFFLGKLTPIFLDRYLIFCIPFLLVLMAYGLSFIKFNSLSIGLCLLFCVFSAFKINYKTEKGMDYRSIAAFIKFEKKPNDLIIVKTKDIKPLFCYYYDPTFFKNQKKDLDKTNHIVYCTSWGDLNENVKQFDRVIVIDSYQYLNPFEREFVKKLSELKPNHAESNFYKGARITLYL